MSNVTVLHSGDPLPPVNYEAEMAFLAALLLDNGILDDAGDLGARHFADDRHGRIYEACRKIIEGGGRADAIRLASQLEDDLEQLGGREYLARIAAAPVSPRNAKGYAAHIVELAARRELMRYADIIKADARDLETEIHNVIDTSGALLSAITDGNTASAGARSLGAIARDVLELIDARRHRGDALLGLPTGLSELDKLTCGLQEDHLTIIAGRPGMGKSTLARHVTMHAAGAGYPVAVFSLEMSGEEWVTQHLSDVADVNLQALRRGTVGDDMARIIDRARSFHELPVHIDDRPGLSVAQMQVSARGLMRRHDIRLVVVDHLGIVRPERPDSRYHEITQISRDLKRMAKSLGIPVLALCQLSRAVEQRDDKRPTLADLRDSGAIEQDADNVLFVYRDHYYRPKAPTQARKEPIEDYQDRLADWTANQNVAEIIVAKQRMGPLGTVRVHFDGSRARFRDLETRTDGETLI